MLPVTPKPKFSAFSFELEAIVRQVLQVTIIDIGNYNVKGIP